jgi:hypothetical protein
MKFDDASSDDLAAINGSVANQEDTIGSEQVDVARYERHPSSH